MAREKAGVTWMRNTQHYVAGALNEEAGEVFMLAMGHAIARGAKTPAEALGMICAEWLARQPRPVGARA